MYPYQNWFSPNANISLALGAKFPKRTTFSPKNAKLPDWTTKVQRRYNEGTQHRHKAKKISRKKNPKANIIY